MIIDTIPLTVFLDYLYDMVEEVNIFYYRVRDAFREKRVEISTSIQSVPSRS